MKRYFVGLLLMLPTLFSFAQDERNIVVDENAQVRKLSGFSGIEVSGAIDLYISQGKEDAVAVSAGNKELVDRIKTEVKNNTLYIHFDGRGFIWKSWTNNKIKAYVTVNNLKRIEASGACNVKSTNKLSCNELSIELSGASNLKAEVETAQLNLDLSGASDLKLNGKAANAKLSCSGASSVKAYDLIINQCNVIASGASDVRITVTKELNAKASGASSINYKGDGIIRESNNSGASSIKHKTTD
jgi:hypothetical protein